MQARRRESSGSAEGLPAIASTLWSNRKRRETEGGGLGGVKEGEGEEERNKKGRVLLPPSLRLFWWSREELNDSTRPHPRVAMTCGAANRCPRQQQAQSQDEHEGARVPTHAQPDPQQ